MRITTFMFLLGLLFSPFMANAHGSLHRTAPISQSDVETKAVLKVATLVYKGKLDESWKSVEASKAEQKANGGQTEWIVTFNNKNVSNPAKRTLYVYYTITGKYLAANFTGK